MLSIGTYNIQKPDASWSTRKPQLLENIQNANLDIVVLQEVSDSESDRADIKKRLEALGYSISTHTEKSGETAVGVIWKKDTFTLLKAFTGTYTNGSDRKRCFSAVDLENKTTKKVYRVASCHLYTAPRDGTAHLGIPQLKTFRTLLEKDSQNISRLIIAGDYNADFERREDATVLNILAQKQDGSEYAYHTVEKDSAGQKIYTKGRNKIDWIFAGCKGGSSSVAPKVTHHPLNLTHPRASDHLMHAVEVHDEDVAYVQRDETTPTHDAPNSEVVRRLQEVFSKKNTIVRDDLIRAGLVTKESCNQMVSGWIQAGLVVQQGRGRDTSYTRGTKLGNTMPHATGTQQSPILITPSPAPLPRSIPNRSRSFWFGRFFTRIFAPVAFISMAVISTVTAVAAVLLLQRGRSRY